jgi:NAD(P)-dependent dehydrogenase (short-subunit alcohol dehydrogenase family)
MNGETVVVTGATGSIGRALVDQLKHLGDTVISVDRLPFNSDLADDRGCNIQADLCSDDGVTTLINVVRTMPAPKHVFLVHGGASSSEVDGDPLALNRDVFRGALEMNLVSVYSVVCALAPFLARSTNSRRSFVLVSSINAFSAFGYPAYSAAKAGLESLVKSLSEPLAAQRVRINAVALGTVTPASRTTSIECATNLSRAR